MSEQPSSRRKFLKATGLAVGATLATVTALHIFEEQLEIAKLTPEQQGFMLEYGKWMDEFIAVMRIENRNPDDLENKKKKIALAHRALDFKPELADHLKDATFSMVYFKAIERVGNEVVY
ncbi:MAG: twin-arginine translocation signal domain-containing protein [Flavobacteriales bacterium]|nr:twin-arginine translocation signal domain-containing protein [Flavobacteriales bacterium]